MWPEVIDRLREQIQQRLDQLVNEADRLRKALAALDPRSLSPPARKPSTGNASGRAGARATAAEQQSLAPSGAPARPRTRPGAARRRTAPGATKAAVLAALAGGEAMTAGEVADKAGLARGTVSTTLSKLAKSGEVQKAERGYKVAPGNNAPGTVPPAAAAVPE